MPDYESLAGDLKEAAEFPGYGIGEEVDVTMQRERFLNAMEDDLDLPGAIEALREIAQLILEAPEEDGVRDAQKTLRELSDVLGLTLGA
ncbi:MAG: DALR domain-containing protein [Thermomicrobiales bacterium]